MAKAKRKKNIYFEVHWHDDYVDFFCYYDTGLEELVAKYIPKLYTSARVKTKTKSFIGLKRLYNNFYLKQREKISFNIKSRLIY